MPGRRFLVVTHFYPPLPGVGANRWAAMARHLRELGHDVTVVTTSAFGALDDDEATRVVRTGDLADVRWLRRLLRRPPLPRPGMATPTEKPPPALLTKVVVPDALLVSWSPFALREAARIARERDIECLITSSPFESTHLVGLALRRARPGLRWLADFRDGWIFDPVGEPPPTRAQRALNRRLERSVVVGADGVLAATRPMAEDLRRRHGVAAAYVPNGWDPALDAEVEAAEPPPLPAGKVAIVHTGTLSGPHGRSPLPLFEAVRRLVEEDHRTADRMRLVVAGRPDERERRLFDEAGLGQWLVQVGHLARPAAVALQRRADVLLLLTSRQASLATGKLSEYLTAGRPILALAEGNEAERIVRETGTGTTVAPDDPVAIADALRAAAQGELMRHYAPRGLETYRYPGPACAVAAEAERALGR